VKRRELLASYQRLRKVNGWFSFHDFAIFHLLLGNQVELSQRGDLLEIGVFAGKSAVVIGNSRQKSEEFHTCDIFDSSAELKNSIEIDSSYPGLSRTIFEKNYLQFLGELPVIHQCPSHLLPERLVEKEFRFIHIDGSHLYENIIRDLQYSTDSIHDGYGVIAVDDYRSYHTIGVSMATWEFVISGKLIPIIITPAKIYLGTELSNLNLENLKGQLRSLEIDFVVEELMGMEVIRTLGLKDSEMYTNERIIWKLLPPMSHGIARKFLGKLRKLASFAK
jgi:hypothetical protein